MIIIRRLYGCWCLIWFLFFFFTTFPFMFLFLQRKAWYDAAHQMNRIWGYTTFFFCGIPVQKEYRFRPDKTRAYVFCPNHTSYMDIPVLYMTIKSRLTFIAKSSLSKVPLFGYMYKRLQINVDRNNLKSKYETFRQASRAIDEGRSIVIFPEGTIPRQGHPDMLRFKDGPFRIAIEKQIPVVPVTIPFNWIILPDKNMLAPRWRPVRIILHEPIDTTGMSLNDLEALKEKTFRIIDQELKKQNNLS